MEIVTVLASASAVRSSTALFGEYLINCHNRAGWTWCFDKAFYLV